MPGYHGSKHPPPFRRLLGPAGWAAVILVLPACGGGGGGGGGPTGRPWQGALSIESDAGVAIEPDIAFAGNGNAIAMWRQFGSTVATPIAHYGAYSNRFVLGGGWEGRIQVNDTANDCVNPRIALDAAGHALATWEEANSDDLQRWRRPVGTGTWEIQATVSTSADHAAARIAFDLNGNAIAVWQAFDTLRWNIEAGYYTAGGTYAAAVDIDGALGNAQHPGVGFDAAGNAMVVWQHDVGADQNILSKRYLAGVGWGAVVPVETAAGIAAAPELAVDAAGNAIAVWYRTGAVGNDIWASRYDVVGDAWSAPVLLETDDTAGALNPRIAGNAAGDAMVVWRQSDGTWQNILANRYVAGAGWQGAVPIETNTGNAGNPWVALDAAGNAAAVWAQSDGSFDSVYDNRFSVAGGWGAAALLETMTGNADAPRIALDSLGNGFAIWSQNQDIWVNRYQP